MNRTVNTNKVTLDLNRVYVQPERDLKPTGLWYAIDNEWVEWCTDNMDHWIKLNNIKLEISTINMLILRTFDDIEMLDKNFGYNLIEGSSIRYIDWENIARRYKGIEIRNVHNLKFAPQRGSKWKIYMFLEAWDVSSGCIWDLSIIKSYEIFRNSKK